MAIYVVTGKLGTGKSKYCVGKAREAIQAGRRVASNIELQLDHLMPKRPKARYVRLPDKPTVRDLQAMGHGNPDSYDEDRNGVLILDELGSWLNARDFMDGERKAVIDWLIHARKHGWDVYFIAQSIQQIDKQVRESLAEFIVTCYRLDKIPIPVVSIVAKTLFGKGGRLPKFHVAAVKINLGGNNWHVTERDWFLGIDLHKAYDTRQVFTPDPESVAYTKLSPHYFTPPAKPASLLSRLLGGVHRAKRGAPLPAAPRPKHPLVALLCGLPPDERIRELHRLQRYGIV